MKKIFIIGILLLVAFTNTAFAVENKNEDVNAFIDPSIQGEERRIITEIIKILPVEDRENVYYFAPNGNVYVNKQKLKSNITPFTQIGENLYKTSFGEIFTGLNDSSELIGISNYSCVFANGPYRRVYSKSGYSFYSGTVYLPSDSEVEDGSIPNVGNGDTAYIYTGGRSSTGTEVDTGFQHGETYDDWAMFLRPTGGGERQNGPRFSGGQYVDIEFNVPQDGKVSLKATGIVKGESTRTSHTLITDASGFKQNGTGNIIKRLTTMAQKTENYGSGSFVKNVKWYNSKIGTSKSNATQWLASQTGGYCIYPSDKNIIQVNFVNAGEETVNIVLNYREP